MSNPWLPRTPAFEGGHPASPPFHPADTKTARWLLEVTGLKGEVSRLATSAAPPYGHFRVQGPDGEVFAKVLETGDAERHRLADELAACAVAGGAPAMPPGQWIETGSGPEIGLYPYIEARYGQATVEDACRLGVAIAELHRALRSCARSEGVRAASAERMHGLRTRRERILSGKGPLGPEPEALQSLARELPGAFELPAAGQVVHGDLNLGNVLFDVEGGRPTIIDFETATVSWLPPRVDVAMAMQRFCLTVPGDAGRKAESAVALLRAYRDLERSTPLHSVSDLAAELRWISLRNLCLLAELQDRGSQVAETEWRKFLKAAEEAEAVSSILKPFVPW